VKLPPAVVVHGLPDALAAVRPGLPVTLLSAPGAASYAGALWWRAVIAAARAASPDVEVADVLDCADAPGRAMAALREGQRLLVLDATAPGYDAVRDAAATLAATVLPQRPPALDLATPYADERLLAWLLDGVRPIDGPA
jgi:hypothetical protein